MRAAAVALGIAALAAALGVMSASAFAARSEMEALTRQGISRAHAERALSLQQRVAETKLASKIRAALGDAYAGVWFEPVAAKFYAGVTSTASRQAVMRLASDAGLADDVVATPVRSTLKALIAAQRKWNKRLASLMANGDVGTAIAPQTNAVQVRLSTSVSPSERAAIENAAAKAHVNTIVSVEQSPKLRVVQEAKKTCEKAFTPFNAFCEEAITAGVGIRKPGGTKVECTAGPELISVVVTFMLTAGHCIELKATLETGEVFANKEVASAFPSEFPIFEEFHEIGKEGKRYWTKERDMAEVVVVPHGQGGNFAEPVPTPVPALVTEWNASPEKPHAVEGVEEAVEGEIVCHEGAATGEQCGKIVALYVTNGFTENLVETGACSAGGDSGGPYFMIVSTKLLMLGVHIGKPTPATPSCGQAGIPRTVFEPLVGLFGAEQFGILNTFAGQPLLTTANENRAKSAEEEKELKEQEEKELKEKAEKEEKEHKEQEEKEHKEKEEKEHKGLPDISLLAGESYPLHLDYSSETVKSKLSNPVETLEGEGLEALVLCKELTSLCEYKVDVKHVKNAVSKNECKTEGDAAGVVLVTGNEAHFVAYLASGVLKLGLLFLMAEFKAECGTLKIKIKGSMLASVGVTTESDHTEVGIGLTGNEKGKPTLTTYYNDSKEEVKAKLEANFGAGYKEGAEEIAGEPVLKALEGKMFAINGW